MNEAQKKISLELLKAYQFRFACKEFDGTQTIPENLFQIIIEAGHLSPSSFGLEPWKFLIIQNNNLREKIKEVSWGAYGKLPEASHFIIGLTRSEKELDPFGEYIRYEIMDQTQHLPPEFADTRAQRIKDYLALDIAAKSPRALRDWAAKQIYIPMANMMTAAALLGVDSCPIEGFSHKVITELLEEYHLLEDGKFVPTCMIAFGYRKEEPILPKTRRSIDKVFQWVE